MMIESLNPDLAAHRGAPDKDPERRLATLRWAGELAIPFTTGILVGIGESRSDRVVALEAIAAAHRDFGHVQEVIVQNFVPKPGTLMRDAPACSMDDLLETIALARPILPAEVHLQAPPNLVDDPGALIDAGIDDFGGISPVTADHVNPERPWPHVDVLRAAVESRGLALAPRLTIYPEFASEPARWLDENVRFAVLDRSDAESMGRDDPGATYPERHEAAANVGTGAEVIQVGRRSTAWYSGADRSPPVLVPGPSHAGTAVAEVLTGVELGQEPGHRRAHDAVRRHAGRRSSRSPSSPTGCGSRSSATTSRSCATATSTTPTCARSSARSAGSPRARCRSTCAASRTCSPTTRSPTGSARPPSSAPPRCACRAASTPTSTATTTSTSPRP